MRMKIYLVVCAVIVALLVWLLSVSSPPTRSSQVAPAQPPEMLLAETVRVKTMPSRPAPTPAPATPESLTESVRSIKTVRVPVAQKAATISPIKNHDICRGKGKNYTNNGRSWRCKR